MKAKHIAQIRKNIRHYKMWEIFTPSLDQLHIRTRTPRIIYGYTEMGALLRYLRQRHQDVTGVAFSSMPNWVVNEVGTKKYVNLGRV